MKLSLKRSILILLVIAQMSFIFCMSARDGTKSSGDSLGVTRIVCSVIFDDWKDMSAAEQEAAIEQVHGWVRVGGHFTEFAVLGLLLMFAAWESTKPAASWVKYASSWIIGTLYAASDEFHQIYVPGRACELKDMIVDSSGIIIGIAAAASIMYIKSRKKTD